MVVGGFLVVPCDALMERLNLQALAIADTVEALGAS
jgi:hypothetical protein